MSDATSDPTLAGSLPSVPSTASSSHLQIELGVTRVGRYLVLDELGRGGMGVVYEAFDPELDRRVAVKVLKRWDDGVEGSQGHKRLLREAQAMARLKHPNVVTVHDAGLHDGRVFVALELVEGTTLTKWLKAEPRSVADILGVFVQAGRGLAAAHAKGLVHRDFKPDNVMIEPVGPVARVMDFGLARAAGPSKPVRATPSPSSDPFGDDLTQDGKVVGTPRYMAPEQHLSTETDASSDQFAFCVALWEALDGQHPYGGDTLAELVARVVAGTRRTPTSEAKLPPRIRRALERGLAAESSQRWTSLDALLDELAADPSRTRRRVLLAVGAVVAIAGAFLTERVIHARGVDACRESAAAIDEVWSAATRDRIAEQMRASGIAHAQLTFERLVPWIDTWAIRWRGHSEQACLAGDVDATWNEATAAKAYACLDERREVLVGLLAGLEDPDAGTLGQAIGAAAELPRPEDCVDERHLVLLPNVEGDGGSRAREIRAQLSRTRGLTEVGRLDDAAAAVEAILADASGLARSTIEATILAGDVAKAKADYEGALVHYREAFAAALEHDAPDLALDAVLGLMGTSGTALVRAEEGLAWEPVGRALLRRLGEERSRRAARLLQTLGTIHHKQAEYERARELLSEALEIQREQVGDDHPALESSLEALAVLELDLGDYDRATELATRMLELKERIYGADHPNVAFGLALMGLVRDARADYSGSEQLNRRALAIRESAFGPDHPLVAASLINVALAMYRRGDNEGARPLLERALAVQEATLGPEHPDLTITLINLGNVQQNLQDNAAASSTYARALELARVKLGPDHSTVGVVLANLSNTALNLGRLDEAIEHQRGALAILEARFGPDHPNVATALMNLGQLLNQKEQYEAALDPLQRALAILENSLGGEHPDIAYALIGIADARLGLGERTEANAAAERVLAIREANQASPIELANARFTLAKTLDDPARVRLLVALARAGFETADPGMIALVDEWLRAYERR